MPGGEPPWWCGGLLLWEWPATAGGGWITVGCDRIVTHVTDQRGAGVAPAAQVCPIGAEIIEWLADIVEFGTELAADLLIRVGGVIFDLPDGFWRATTRPWAVAQDRAQTAPRRPR